MYWIIEKRDDAILGAGEGTQSQKVVAGPFETLQEAHEERSQYQGWGSIYYTVKHSAEKPPEWEREYQFERGEFEDY